MGISGLLPLLRSIQTQRYLSDFKGQTLAVDGYVWLHKGTYSCATELATGKATSKLVLYAFSSAYACLWVILILLYGRYVEYAMKNVRLLRFYGITPYLVFDGGPLPAKRGTEDGRQQKREENLEKGNTLAAQGRHSAAREFYCKCVDVTPQMAYQLIKVSVPLISCLYAHSPTLIPSLK